MTTATVVKPEFAAPVELDKKAMTRLILRAKSAKGYTWEKLAEAIGMSPVYTCSACLGENSMSADVAAKLVKALDLPAEVGTVLQECPYKGTSMAREVPTDPLIYRFYEVILVYGDTIKEIIHEKFGDGIMSAIDFTMDIDKDPDPKGDRVVVTMSGKYLAYKRW